MFGVGADTPYTLANSRYTAPPKPIFIYDMYGIPHGMPTNIPFTKKQQTLMDVYAKQVTRQNRAIERYVRHLKRIPTESLQKEIQRRRNRKAFSIATSRYKLNGNEDTDRIIRSFLMGKPKKPTKAGKSKVGKPKKPTKVGKSKVGKPKKPTKVGKSKVGKPKKQLKKKK
jgi:hypothetical protein